MAVPAAIGSVFTQLFEIYSEKTATDSSSKSRDISESILIKVTLLTAAAAIAVADLLQIISSTQLNHSRFDFGFEIDSTTVMW